MMRNPDTPGRCRVGILLVPVFMARYYSMRGPRPAWAEFLRRLANSRRRL